MAYEHKKPSSVAESPDLFTVYTFKGSAMVRQSSSQYYSIADQVGHSELDWCNRQEDPTEYSVLCIGVTLKPSRAEIVGVLSPTGHARSNRTAGDRDAY